jgi:hypothetical protein
MLRPKFGEELSDGPHLSVAGVFDALADSFASVGSGGNIEQALIGFSVLNDGSCLAFDGEHDRALGFFELFHEVAGAAAEGREGLDVFGDIEHGRASFMDSTFLSAHRRPFP